MASVSRPDTDGKPCPVSRKKVHCRRCLCCRLWVSLLCQELLGTWNGEIVGCVVKVGSGWWF